jgi:hypothetical protein
MSVIVNASTSTGLGITSDNSGNVEIQSNGTTKLTVQTSGVSGTITTATAQASTSGTSIDFTGIPSWAKKITVILNGVSTNGTSAVQIQIGSGSVETSGYLGSTTTTITSSATTTATTGVLLDNGTAPSAAATRIGNITFILISGNTWISSGVYGYTNTPITGAVAYSKTTAGSLDRIRLTTVNGTDTFDAGSINIMYEG